MPKYNEVLKFTAHKNHERFSGDVPLEKGKPNFGQASITLHSALPAGEYTASVWQYCDTMNLGFSLSSIDHNDADAQQPAADPAAPLPQARRSFDDV